VQTGIVCALVFACATPAFAQQPYSTEEADVARPRSVKLSVGAEFDALQPEDTDHSRQTTIMMRAAYGATDNLELDASAPIIYLQNAAEPNAAGYGDTTAGLKYRVREDSRGPAVALAFSVQAPTGDADRDIGSGVTMTWLNAIVEHKLSSQTAVAGNLGFMPTGNPSIGALGINAHRGKILTFGASLTRDVTGKLKMGAAVDGATTTTGDVQHQLHVTGGGNYQLRRGATLDAGVIVGHYTRTPRFGVIVGVTATVPSTAAAE
jgi:hypothetical protein